MPKIIPEIESRIVAAAKKHLDEKEDFTMREIAKELDIAVGTIYRYFPDKIHLVAVILLGDYQEKRDSVVNMMTSATSLEEALKDIYHLISDFAKDNHGLFSLYGKNISYRLFTERVPLFIQDVANLFKGLLTHFKVAHQEKDEILLSELFLSAIKNHSVSEQDTISFVMRWIGNIQN